MAPSSFEEFLTRSLALLEREKPAVFARVCAMLADKELGFCIDGVPVVLRFAPDPQIVATASAPHIRLSSDRRTILDVLDGLGLEDAVMQERIVLSGSLADLILFHDALLAYLHGAVRAPAFPRLFDEYRGAGKARPSRRGPARAAHAIGVDPSAPRGSRNLVSGVNYRAGT